MALHGLVHMDSREGIYELLQTRLSELELKVSTTSTYMTIFLDATRLFPAIQVLQSSSPLHLQEKAALSAFTYASELVNTAKLLRSQSGAASLPIYIDGFVLMATLLILKIHISRFSSLVDAQTAQDLIKTSCTYYRDSINGFSTIPARLTIFMDGMRRMAMENHLPRGGFVLEAAKCHYILYEVLWDFYEWKQKSVGDPEFQSGQQSSSFDEENAAMGANLGNIFSIMDLDLPDPSLWQFLGPEPLQAR